MLQDLTSVAACKAWLGLTSTADDALLADLVTSVSRAILADLGRPQLLPATFVETFDGGGTALPLRHWPATQVVGVSVEGVGLPESMGSGQAGWTLEAPDAAPPGAMQCVTMRVGCFPAGRRNVAVTYRAGYEIIGETALVPSIAPFIVQAQAPFGAWVQDTGVSGATNGYGVDAGAYTFAPNDAGRPVTLNYAYVPADLARAACEWVADRYASRTRIGQSAKTLGGQETTSFIVKAMPDVVSRLLQPYRRVAR